MKYFFMFKGVEICIVIYIRVYVIKDKKTLFFNLIK